MRLCVESRSINATRHWDSPTSVINVFIRQEVGDSVDFQFEKDQVFQDTQGYPSPKVCKKSKEMTYVENIVF